MASWSLTEDEIVADFPVENQQQQERSSIENKNALNVLAKLKEFRDKKILCDLVFQVNKTSYQVHKAVFAAWSPKIANLILSNTHTKTDLILSVGYDKNDVFSEFLEYCYSGFVLPTEQNVHSLLDIGRNFLVESLVSTCEEYLKASISPGNFVSRFFTSVKYDMNSLEETVISFIETNLASLMDQHGLLNLRSQDFELFLSAGKMTNTKPEVKLSLIINWVGFSLLDRNKFLFYLLSKISWDHTVGDLLIQINSSENIFTSNEFCLFQLLQCVVNSTGYHLGPFMNTYQRLFSLYSHMLEELANPKVFSVSSSRIDDIVLIPVAVMSHSEPSTNMKDAEMNTDVDSSYFQDTQTILTTQLLQESPIENIGLEEEVSTDKEKELCDKTNDDICETSTDVAEINPQEGPDLVSTISHAKHRRKGKPRKIAVPEPRPKRNRGRPRKCNKENDDARSDNSVPLTPASDSLKDIRISPERKSSRNKHEGIENEEGDIDGQSNADNNGDGSAVKTEMDNIENMETNSAETKPKIKLNLKLKCLKSTKSKSRHKSGVSKKSNHKTKKSNTTRVFKCSYENCGYTSVTEYRLVMHIENVHNVDVKLHCRSCEYTTNQMRELCLHMKTHFTKTPYLCDNPGCNQKFLRMGLLVRHQMSHMNEKPYKCDQCNKSFGTLNQLRCHKKLHEERQFECDVCMKKFTTKGAMQQHRAIHFDNKPYLCDTCGFCTKHLSHLISHRKIHSGDVLHCTFPNCSYTSPKQAHMTQHINRHLNIRNHICQVCGKSFVVRGKLLRHERIHLKEKLYKCKQCDYQTSRLDRMKLHIESHGIKFKKKQYNLPIESEGEKPEIDFHQFYERVQSNNCSSEMTDSEMTLTSIAGTELKPMDAISLAASASMIVDSYTAPRLLMDPISGEATMEESLTFQQGFERIHETSFDQL